MTWIEICNEKIHELELIAQWGSMVNLGIVRDYCRLAQAEIKAEISFRESLESKDAKSPV